MITDNLSCIRLDIRVKVLLIPAHSNSTCDLVSTFISYKSPQQRGYSVQQDHKHENDWRPLKQGETIV